MKNIIEFLRGKKTYFVGMLMILLGYLQDDHQLMLEGLGFIFLRAGVKEIKK